MGHVHEVSSVRCFLQSISSVGQAIGTDPRASVILPLLPFSVILCHRPQLADVGYDRFEIDPFVDGGL